MSYNGRGRRDKRSALVKIITVAVIALCLMSSLQEKHGAELGLPALKGTLALWLEELGIDIDGLLEAPASPEAWDGAGLKVHFIDVGQGKAILIQAPTSTVLIDSGVNESISQLTAYLREQKVNTIDMLIATHPHADHIGGMDQIVRDFDVRDILMPDLPMELIPTTSTFTRLLEAIDAKNLPITPARAGKTYDLGDGATLQILAPAGDYDDLNNWSIVARAEYRQVSFLFTGDIEADAEADILDTDYLLSADILDVAHHGSNSSTTAAFLEAVSPRVAVFSCGLDNSYGHPHREPLSRLEATGAELFRTDLDGTVVITTDGLDWAVSAAP